MKHIWKTKNKGCLCEKGKNAGKSRGHFNKLQKLLNEHFQERQPIQTVNTSYSFTFNGELCNNVIQLA